MEIKTKVIAEIIKDFDKIFKGVKSCSNCPAAHCNTATVARVRGTIYSKESGCCSRCAVDRAYFGNRSLVNEFKKLQDTYGWDFINGFFDTEKKTCKLPRYSRSVTCQRYMCDELRKEIGEENHKKVFDGCNKLEGIRINENKLV